MIKPEVKVGQRWMLINHKGHEKYLLVEVLKINSTWSNFCTTKVIELFIDKNLSTWQLNEEMKSDLLFYDHWEYLKGQDNPE
jgi:hypothetical protein